MNLRIFMILVFPLTFMLIMNVFSIEASQVIKLSMFSLLLLIGYLELKILDEVDKEHGTSRSAEGNK